MGREERDPAIRSSLHAEDEELEAESAGDLQSDREQRCSSHRLFNSFDPVLRSDGDVSVWQRRV